MDGAELLQTPNQLGTAILKASSGAVVKATGQLEGAEAEKALKLLHEMLCVSFHYAYSKQKS